METKFYDLRKTDAYRNAESVYAMLPEEYKYRIEPLVSKEVYAALIFYQNILYKIEFYCDKFFDCDEHGFSYELGCYFQKREYQNEEYITRDIDKFKRLLKVYNSSKFPQEVKIIENLLNDLEDFLEKWKAFEINYPELFKND